ncbi:MAG: hypothetical protein JXQ82_00725 [Methanomicrobiaceae archaeon]|nr:hypothetical protein [Methanomicrobiaceae archaeon]
MSDGGASECIGNFILIGILVILASAVSVYTLNIASTNIPEDYTPQYAFVKAEAAPALSSAGTWEADSVKIEFFAGNELKQEYNDSEYAGTETIQFLLFDPNGILHEAVQCIAMKGKTISPGEIYYFFTLSDDINGRYYITNQYSRISDDSTWSDNMTYPKPLANGTWRVVIRDSILKTIIANEEVVIE